MSDEPEQKEEEAQAVEFVTQDSSIHLTGTPRLDFREIHYTTLLIPSRQIPPSKRKKSRGSIVCNVQRKYRTSRIVAN